METNEPADQRDRGPAWSLLDDNGIDEAWLGQELNRAGFGGRISRIEPTLVGTGQVGENVRCRLRWHDEATDAATLPGPDSVVIKLASSNETSRAAAEATRTYIREVGFYRDVARTVAIRVPAVHHVSEDRGANRFILVMEDIAPAEAGNQLEGCTRARAELAIDAAADLHGSTWDRPDLADLDWIDEVTDERVAERLELFHMVYPGFVDRYRDRLAPDHLMFGNWLAANLDRLGAARGEPQCLVHGDFRLDNMLFGTAAPAPPLTTVDWQTPSRGAALSDVAYFLSGSLPPAELRQLEPELLTRYRGRLAEHGVELSSDDAWTQYRASAPAGYLMAVIASQIVGRTERGDQMFMVMAAGSAAMALDLDTPAVVS